MLIMANVADASSRPRPAPPRPASSFYRLGRVRSGAPESVPLPSSSTDEEFEDAGNDSVVEVVPTPRKIPEIDLTSSPLPNAAARNKSASTRICPVATGCKICLESISDIRHSRVKNQVTTSCGHLFCSFCIQSALKKSPTCPVCRARDPKVIIIYDLVVKVSGIDRSGNFPILQNQKVLLDRSAESTAG